MGGHGGLNILPQKEWNVYNNDNREVVRRDEERINKEVEKRKKKKIQNELDDIATTLKGGIAPIRTIEESQREYKIFQEENRIYHQVIEEEKEQDSQIIDEIKECMFKPVSLDEHVNLFKPEEIQDKYRTHQQQMKAKSKGVGEQTIGIQLKNNRQSWYNRADPKLAFKANIKRKRAYNSCADEELSRERVQRESKEKQRIMDLLKKVKK